MNEAWQHFFPVLNLGERVHWIALLGAVAVARLALSFNWISKAHWESLWDFRIWWHPSARLDYLIILTNIVLKILIRVPRFFGALGLASVVSFSLKRIFGPTETTELSPFVIATVFTLASFLIEDYSRYWLHRLQHELGVLWRFHQVHHSAEVMTPFTLNRTHPADVVLGYFRSTLALGLVTGIIFYFFGSSVDGWSVLGVDLAGVIFSVTGANLRHSHVALSYGQGERILLSPAQHQLHHHLVYQRVPSANFGSCFAFWDLWHRTWQASPVDLKGEAMIFGVSDLDRNHHPHHLISAWLGPFWRKSKKTGSLK